MLLFCYAGFYLRLWQHRQREPRSIDLFLYIFFFVDSFITVAVGRGPRGRLASHVSAVRPGQSTKHVTAGLAVLLQVRLSPFVAFNFLCG